MNRASSSLLLLVACLAAPAVAAGETEAAHEGAAGPRLVKTEVWAPDSRVAPRCWQEGNGQVAIAANGTPSCSGGWQFVYEGVEPGQGYRLSAHAQYAGRAVARDVLVAAVLWDRWEADSADSRMRPWNYLLPRPATSDAMDFEAVVRAPAGATTLTVRYTFRWSPEGESRWSRPEIEPVRLAELAPVKVCVVAATAEAKRNVRRGQYSGGKGLPADVAESVDLWAGLVEMACSRKPQLVVLPEVVVGGEDRIEGAIEVPGPATAPFQQLARQHTAHIVVGLRERAGDAFYNSAVLCGPSGQIDGVYRKVHLAISEGLSGLSAGDAFPVFQTSIGPVGAMICMDTTVAESARLLALGGAEFICFPIMGDLRADRWSAGKPEFNEDIWKAIMRTRAIDNQVVMVIARNAVRGSAIINRRGDILAWNDGSQTVIEAVVDREDGFRVWNGGDFREVTFDLRRPHLYGAFIDEADVGGPRRGLKSSGP